MEKEYAKLTWCSIRDSDPKTHPVIFVKDESNKEIHIPKPTATVPPQPIQQAAKPIILKPEEVKTFEENKSEASKKTAAKA